jgi:hypothetical protein
MTDQFLKKTEEIQKHIIEEGLKPKELSVNKLERNEMKSKKNNTKLLKI